MLLGSMPALAPSSGAWAAWQTLLTQRAANQPFHQGSKPSGLRGARVLAQSCHRWDVGVMALPVAVGWGLGWRGQATKVGASGQAGVLRGNNGLMFRRAHFERRRPESFGGHSGTDWRSDGRPELEIGLWEPDQIGGQLHWVAGIT